MGKGRTMNGYLWMALAGALFACLRVMVRLASEHAPWAEVAALRTLTGALVSFALAQALGSPLAIGRPRDAWSRSLFGTVGLLLLFYVLSSPGINVGDIAVLTATSPIFVAIVAPYLLAERTAPALWLCVGISAAGVVLVARPNLETAGVLMLVTLLSAITSGVGNVFTRRLGPHASAEAIVLHFALVSSTVLMALAVWTWTWPSPMGWLLIGVTGFVGCLGQLAQTRAYSLVPAAWISVFGYVSIVFTQIIAVIVLGESITPSQAVGSALIIGSGLLLVHARAGPSADAARAAAAAPSEGALRTS